MHLKQLTMFKSGNKSKEKKLQKKYNKLMKEAYRLSKTDRKLSDEKYSEADQIKALLGELN